MRTGLFFLINPIDFVILSSFDVACREVCSTPPLIGFSCGDTVKSRFVQVSYLVKQHSQLIIQLTSSVVCRETRSSATADWFRL